MAYGGFQRGQERLEIDPETGEQRVVADDVEVSPMTQHERSPLGQMFAPDMTNLGIYAALAALGADSFVGGGAGSGAGNVTKEIAVNSLGSNAGHTGTFFGNMAAQGIPGQGLTGLGSAAGSNIMAPAISTNAMRGASMGMKAGGGGSVPSVFNEMAKRGGVATGGAAPAVGLRQPQSIFQNIAKGGMRGTEEATGSQGLDFGKLAKLMGLQFGMDMLSGLFGGDDPNERKSFEGTGSFTDPVTTQDRSNRAAHYVLRGLADRQKRPITGWDGTQSPVAELQYAPEGQEDIVSMLDKALRGR